MMKKTLIALSVMSVSSGVWAVSSANVNGGDTGTSVFNKDGTNLNIGGRAEFRGDFIGNEDGSELEGTMANQSRFRLNIAGTTQISDSLYGFGYYEGEQLAGEESDFTNRYIYAGFGGNWGALSFGQQDTASVQVLDMSNIATYTEDQDTFISSSDESINNTIAYSGNFNQLSIKASYTAGEEDNSDGYGVSGVYRLPMGLGLGLGYSGNEVEDDNAQQFVVGINYEQGGFYTGFTYTTGESYYSDDNAITDEDFDGYEFAASYQFENNFKIVGTYQYRTADEEDLSDFFELTGAYDFNNHLYGYVSYKFNQLNADNIIRTEDADDSLRLGLRYIF